MHGEEDEGTLEALRSAGSLAVLDLLLFDWCDLLRQGREGRWHWCGQSCGGSGRSGFIYSTSIGSGVAGWAEGESTWRRCNRREVAKGWRLRLRWTSSYWSGKWCRSWCRYRGRSRCRRCNLNDIFLFEACASTDGRRISFDVNAISRRHVSSVHVVGHFDGISIGRGDRSMLVVLPLYSARRLIVLTVRYLWVGL